MATTDHSAEQRELSLVGKVEMRIALADSDPKFESILKTYLPPLLLKLVSEHVSVRNKVVSVCQHISLRIKPQTIQLPVAALVQQFKDHDNSLLRHFDLLYIQQGIDRLSSKEKGELLPVIIQGFSKSGKHGPQVFNLLLRLLESFTLPPRGSKEDVEMRNRFGVSEDDSVYLSSWLGKFLLFHPQKGGNATSPGLSAEDYSFLTLQGKEGLWDAAAGGMNLLRVKILTARLLASGLFTDAERFLPALFASADPASPISDVGDDMLKRSLPATDVEDEALVKILFDLYFGASGAPRVQAPLRIKILGLLNKSSKSLTFANNIMRVADDGLGVAYSDGEDTIMTNAPSREGREAAKVRTAIFQYINFAAKYGQSDTLHAIAPRVINRLRDFIDNQGWPKPGPNEDLVSRGYAYEVTGLLAKAGPRNLLIEDEIPSLDILRWLFSSLAQDNGGRSIVVSIEESLATVLSAMGHFQLRPHEQISLEDLLVDQMSQSADMSTNKHIRSTRFVAVRFANRCLPYDSVRARWVDILGCGALDDRAEVREEAERGLSPYWHRMLKGSSDSAEQQAIEFPGFEAVMAQLFPGRMTDESQSLMAKAQAIRSLHPSSFQHIITFARRILFQEAFDRANSQVSFDSDWERRVDAAAESNQDARNAIRSHIQESMQISPAALKTLLCGLFVSLTEHPSAYNGCLIDFLALSPNLLVEEVVPHTEALMPILQANDHSRRLIAARTFGILASHPASNISSIHMYVERLASTSKEWEAAVGSTVSKVHGALVALGFYFSRSVCRGQSAVNSTELDLLVRMLLDILDRSRDSHLLEGAYLSLGQLSMFAAITPARFQRPHDFRSVTDKLYQAAKDGNEVAILSIGQMSMILTEDEKDLSYVEEQLYKLHEVRQAEAHFTVGEALSYLATGWQSTALATKLDVEGHRPEGPLRSKTLGRLLDRTLADCGNTKPSLRKAAVMWALCLLQFCGDHREVQSRLQKCQAAFKRCLSDRDELVQETASRGLGLVYEKGDKALKDDLVRDLVSSFSSDRQSQLAGNVSAETQLFEPGALPTGDGSVSTYKDIMSLASEVGDSRLVYKFMAMASSNAIWSSRAAFGRFGLSNVLSSSSVDGYLANNPKLYPKLYRYRFDPNTGVQRSMNDIWNALVKDSSATIDKYFDDIMEDLLVNILGKEWRVRQASCAAVADLVQGRQLGKYEHYLERIWTQCFKVLDDIKESVRASAANLARVLTGILTRALEVDHSSTKTAITMLKHILPFLLSSSGMDSSAKDVQAFAVNTLLEIIKKSNGKTLRPFIPELLERLIASLSSFEPEAVNYLHLNASKYNLTEQKIDDMRLSSIRSSPLMEAIERCLDLLDDETMAEVQPSLEGAMKSAVGLPSKVGSSRVLVSLSTRRLAVFRPHADTFLKVLEKVVLDRNETVSSSYAVAAGYVARAASDKQIMRLIAFAQRLYFESKGDREAVTPRRSIAAGEIVFAVAKHASDRFNDLGTSALPFIFVAKHDADEHVREQFQNAWNEAVGGSRAVLLYLSEIVSICDTHLSSPQWTLKHTSARSIAEAVVVVASIESPMSLEAGRMLWPALEKALSGKTWDGKEVVLSAFVKFVESAKAYYMQDAAVASAIVKIAIREAKRTHVAYRKHAITSLASICKARIDVDMSDEVFAALEPLLQTFAADEPTETAGDSAYRDAGEVQSTQSGAIEALFASIHPNLLRSNALMQKISHLLEDLTELRTPGASIWRSIYEGLKRLCERLHEEGAALNLESAARACLKTLMFGPELATENLRLLRAKTIVSVTKLSTGMANELRADILALVAKERSKEVLECLSSALPPKG